jgi:glycerol-3-phosphate acyltransferase PlsX
MRSFAAAIDLAYDMVRNRLLDRIEADLDLFHARYPQAAGPTRDNRTRR